MAHKVATPVERPAKTAARGRSDRPKYSRTSVLCNGQIAWKVGSDKDMEINLNDPQKADLRAVIDVKNDLNALNGLQLYRSRPLTPIEIKQPLRHVHTCLPNNVKARTYTGDLFGSKGGVFSCSDQDFNTRLKNVFKSTVRGDGGIGYNDFFRRLRRSEYLLWDVEAEKGHWVAVIAHLYKGNSDNETYPDDSGLPAAIPSVDRNRIDEWCVVSAERSPRAAARVERVKQRLPEVLREGRIRIDKDSEIDPAIWVPMDQTGWASGLFIFALIKTLLHRITEVYCKKQAHQRSLWDPLPGWLNIDEVRAEMQGRAAQRCMASTNYRSRIAIEGVRRYIGVKEVVRADELRPRHKDSRPYFTGVDGPDGRCLPIDTILSAVNTSDEGSDVSFQDTTTDSESSGSASPDMSRAKQIKQARRRRNVPLQRQAVSNLQRQQEKNLAASPADSKGKGKEVAGRTQRQEGKGKGKGKAVDLSGPLEPPPSDVDGWGDTSDDSDLARHIPLGKTNSVSNASYRSEPGPSSRPGPGPSVISQVPQQGTLGGPLEPPPSDIEPWVSDGSDSGSAQHVPLSKFDPAPKTPRPASSKPKNDLQRKAVFSSIRDLTTEIFKGPLDSPPAYTRRDTTTDDGGSDRQVPLGRSPSKSSGQPSQATGTAVTGSQPILGTSPMKAGAKRTAEEAGVAGAGGISTAIAKRLRQIELEKQGYTLEQIESMGGE